MDTCFICEKTLSEGEMIEVMAWDIRTLLAASVQRGEKDHEIFLKDLQSVRVHRSCKQSYADEQNVLAAALRRKCSLEASSSSDCGSSSQTPSDIPQIEQFDFATMRYISTLRRLLQDTMEVRKENNRPDLRTSATADLLQQLLGRPPWEMFDNVVKQAGVLDGDVDEETFEIFDTAQ